MTTTSIGTSRSMKAALLSAALAMVGYVILAGWDDTGAVTSAAAKFSVLGVTWVLALSMGNYLIRYWRWQWYLRELGFSVPTGRGLVYYFAGFSFTTTPGKIGEAVRSVYLSAHGVPYSQSLSVFFVERLSDLLAMVLLACLALVQFPQYRLLVLLVLLAMAVFIGLLLRERLIAAWHQRIAQRQPSKWRALTLRMFASAGHARRLLRPRLLLGGLALSLVAWGAEGVGFYYILQFMHIDVTLAVAIGIYSISVLIGALSFLPGGLGSTEAVMVLLLMLLGVGHGDAIAATLICRIATLWFAVALGGLAMIGATGKRAALPVNGD